MKRTRVRGGKQPYIPSNSVYQFCKRKYEGKTNKITSSDSDSKSDDDDEFVEDTSLKMAQRLTPSKTSQRHTPSSSSSLRYTP